MEIINYFKNCFNLFLFKDEAFKYIQKKVKWQEAFWVTFVITLIFALLDFGMGIYSGGEELNVIEFVLAFVLGIGVIFLFFYIAHLLFRLIGGKAKFFDFFKVGLSVHLGQTIISLIGTIIFVLLILILSLFESKIIIGILFILFIIYIVAILVLNIAVATKYYALTYKISQVKSLFIVLIPIILVILLVILGLIFFAALVVDNGPVITNATSVLV